MAATALDALGLLQAVGTQPQTAGQATHCMHGRSRPLQATTHQPVIVCGGWWGACACGVPAAEPSCHTSATAPHVALVVLPFLPCCKCAVPLNRLTARAGCPPSPDPPLCAAARRHHAVAPGQPRPHPQQPPRPGACRWPHRYHGQPHCHQRLSPPSLWPHRRPLHRRPTARAVAAACPAAGRECGAAWPTPVPPLCPPGAAGRQKLGRRLHGVWGVG